MTIKLKDNLTVCLRCGHLNNGETDIDKRICICNFPVLCPASRVNTMSIGELRLLPEFMEKLDRGKVVRVEYQDEEFGELGGLL